MKSFIRITGKVVLIIILLFLCLVIEPFDVNATNLNVDLEMNQEKLLEGKVVEKIEESTAISKAIENENGGLFENTIAKALGGIAQAVFNISTSDIINLGFKNYDELIFNKTVFTGLTTDNLEPFNSETWNKSMKWYKIFSTLAFIPILIGSIVTSYKFIIAGTTVTRRNEAKDSFMRLFLGGVAIALAPIFVKLLLLINANMVYALVSISTGGLDNLLGNSIFSEIKTGSAIATALIICLFAYLFIKFNIKFIIRKFTLIVFTVFTPLIAGMWIINKNVTGAAIWFGQIVINIFMQFIYAFLFLIYIDFTSTSNGWAVSLLWAMMILPLGDVLLNTMQNLVSRVAGLNNEEMANKGIGMGAAMAYTVHSIGSQFKSNNETNRGIISRIKTVTNDNNENKTINDISTTSRNKTIEKQKTITTNNENNKEKYGISLYGIGRNFLNTGMFLAEGRNFANKGLIGNRENYKQQIRRNETNNNSQKLEKSDTSNDRDS